MEESKIASPTPNISAPDLVLEKGDYRELRKRTADNAPGPNHPLRPLGPWRFTRKHSLREVILAVAAVVAWEERPLKLIDRRAKPF
jgi:hypothetical protein